MICTPFSTLPRLHEGGLSAGKEKGKLMIRSKDLTDVEKQTPFFHFTIVTMEDCIGEEDPQRSIFMSGAKKANAD